MIAQKIDLEKTIAKTPCSTPVLFFFTPSANNPGELHRINILVIEIWLVPHQTQFQLLQIIVTLQNRWYNNPLLKNSFILI